jgi:hypothetical protein
MSKPNTLEFFTPSEKMELKERFSEEKYQEYIKLAERYLIDEKLDNLQARIDEQQ